MDMMNAAVSHDEHDSSLARAEFEITHTALFSPWKRRQIMLGYVRECGQDADGGQRGQDHSQSGDEAELHQTAKSGKHKRKKRESGAQTGKRDAGSQFHMSACNCPLRGWIRRYFSSKRANQWIP